MDLSHQCEHLGLCLQMTFPREEVPFPVRGGKLIKDRALGAHRKLEKNEGMSFSCSNM